MNHRIYSDLYTLEMTVCIEFSPETADIPFQYMMTRAPLVFTRKEEMYRYRSSAINNFTVFIDSTEINRVSQRVTYRILIPSKYVVKNKALGLDKINNIASAIESISMSESVRCKQPTSAYWGINSSGPQELAFFNKYPKLF